MDIIKIDNLHKKYRLFKNDHEKFVGILFPKLLKIKSKTIYKGLNLTIKKGEILGIIGKNGSGKSTLLKLISEITTPDIGSVEVFGRVVSLLELGTGFHPELTGRKNIYFYCRLLGMKPKEVKLIYDKIIAFADIGDYIDQPLKKYSSGMRSRLAFSCAIHVNPDILILDEVLSVGDLEFRVKSMKAMEDLKSSAITIIFVSHNLGAVKSFCSRVIWVENGEVVSDGLADTVCSAYIRKYS